jgi:cell shape-determining protein MreD
MLVLFAVSVLACAVPDFVPAALGIQRHAPDLFVAMAVALGLRGRGPGALAGAVVLGALKDCASLDPLGTHAFVLGVVALVFQRSDGGEPVRGASRAILVALGVLLAHALLLVRMLVIPRLGVGFASIGGAFPTALWTALVSWPLLSALDRLHLLDDFGGSRRGLSA